MGGWGWIVALMVTGAVFEVTGLAAAVLEIRSERRKVQRFLKRPITIQISAAGEVSSAGELVLTGGREPTVEERVRLLEQTVKDVKMETEQMKLDLPTRWHRDIAEVEKRVGTSLNEYRGQLDRFLRESGTKWRYIGITMFVFGLALQTWGNVWSMVRSG